MNMRTFFFSGHYLYLDIRPFRKADIRLDFQLAVLIIRPDTRYIKKAGLSGQPDIRCIPLITTQLTLIYIL